MIRSLSDWAMICCSPPWPIPLPGENILIPPTGGGWGLALHLTGDGWTASGEGDASLILSKHQFASVLLTYEPDFNHCIINSLVRAQPVP